MRDIAAVLCVTLVGCMVGEAPEEATGQDTNEAVVVSVEGRDVRVPPAFERMPGVARIELPLGLAAADATLPTGDTLDPALIDLGNLLFFDKRLSKGGVMSCATCHDPAHGYAAPTFVKGVGGNRLARTSMPATNRAFGSVATWDGRRTLEEQATAPITSAAEMGLTRAELLAAVQAVPGYVDRFRRLVAAGVLPGPAITVDNIQRAIATFERGRLLTGGSRVDRYRAGDITALDADEKRGMFLFETQARCSICHTGSNFSDESFHHIVNATIDPATGQLDTGVMLQTGDSSDYGLMKVPSLRNVGLRGPYFHNGDPFPEPASTLAIVVHRYNNGANTADRNVDPQVVRLGLSDGDQAQLVKFLLALSGDIPDGGPLSDAGLPTSDADREAFLLSPAVFNAAQYRAAYADLAGMTLAQVRAHWLSTGIAEGRRATRTFSVKEYIGLYRDVNDAVATDAQPYLRAIEHYLTYGRAKGYVGRHALAPGFFDIDDYRANNGIRTALLSYDAAINDYLTTGLRDGLVASDAPKGLFSIRGATGIELYYADGRTYCAMPARTNLVTIPMLPAIPTNLLDGGTCNTATSPPTPAKVAPIKGSAIVQFSCARESSNSGCSKTVSCPGGMHIIATRAACNLELSTLGDATVPATAWNALRVVRESDNAREGHCRVGGMDIAEGDVRLLRPYATPASTTVSCQEHDDNGGDCAIKGELLCSE